MPTGRSLKASQTTTKSPPGAAGADQDLVAEDVAGEVVAAGEDGPTAVALVLPGDQQLAAADGDLHAARHPLAGAVDAEGRALRVGEGAEDAAEDVAAHER